MSTYKTNVDLGQLSAFFQEHDIPTSNLETIADGEVSQVYFFERDGLQKVLRFNSHTNEGFSKDKLAFKRFSSLELPIPKIDEIGQLPGDLFYSISQRAQGKTVDKLSADEFKAALPAIISTMDAIHHTPPIGSGFGKIGLDGNGQFSSWHKALDAMQERRVTRDKPDVAGFFERDLYDKIGSRIQSYYKYCPDSIRQLIHTDYGFQNTLFDDGQVTGVIDWDGVSYGDPMYDVAWQDFWLPAFGWPIDVVSEIKRYYMKRDQLPKNFEERIICYKMIIAANSMSFFAKSEQAEKYTYARDEVLKISPVLN